MLIKCHQGEQQDQDRNQNSKTLSAGAPATRQRRKASVLDLYVSCFESQRYQTRSHGYDLKMNVVYVLTTFLTLGVQILAYIHAMHAEGWSWQVVVQQSSKQKFGHWRYKQDGGIYKPAIKYCHRRRLLKSHSSRYCGRLQPHTVVIEMWTSSR